ncbi:hypothetical protein NC652_006513 [Populus alba x Populus x berolinensis]|nr:hypothetical protein NC652_006513 [Populus alba x Populus x berolinensis]
MKAVVSTGSPIQMNQKFQISISNSVFIQKTNPRPSSSSD